MIERHYAHSLPNQLPEAWEPLSQHLQLVAEGGSGLSGAAQFAAAFDAEEWGRVLGWWHDVGKYSTEFQNRLLAANGFEAALETLTGRVDHSTAGARLASAKAPGAIGRILAYCIAGHHGGMPNFCCEDGGAELRQRLSPNYAIPSWDAAPDHVLNLPPPNRVPLCHPARSQRDGLLQLSTFCRMVFSCLVDADFLATEHFMRPDSAAARPARAPTMADLEGALTQHLNKFTSLADETQTASSVNQLRAAVLAACREKALLSPGLFSLTVPTGGGKTLSSLAFALRHAVSHGLRRVIYAIPYTSIIEQNAGVLRQAMSAAGDDVVLEHHSNFDPEEESPIARLAAENWDAPVVVTTNVQFFESLFANRPSRCRKLHRIARSVIILDECQTLPATLLRPTLAMLQELVRHYGCTIVLCSATMPAVTRREDFAIGLEGVREIIDDSPRLFAALKRVEVQRAGPLKDDELAGRLAELPQVLCVVNTKATAASLYHAVAARVDQGVFHLSAAMCPAHRESVLKRVKTALQARESCRVISTQVIEAGVDVDFPVVYRALAGLDSIAQAAGRCNREGRLPIGRVVVFDPEQGTPSLFRAAADAATEVAGLYGDWLSLDAIAHYFRLVYWQRTADWDKHGIMRLASIGTDGLDIRFQSIADAYRLIADDQVPVLVRYDETAQRLIDDVERSNEPPDQRMRRRLQRYAVSVYKPIVARMIAEQAVVELQPGVFVAASRGAYDASVGLNLKSSGADPEHFVV